MTDIDQQIFKNVALQFSEDTCHHMCKKGSDIVFSVKNYKEAFRIRFDGRLRARFYMSLNVSPQAKRVLFST